MKRVRLTFRRNQRRRDDVRDLALMQWGMMPSGGDLASWKAYLTINARAETLLAKPLWRSALERGHRAVALCAACHRFSDVERYTAKGGWSARLPRRSLSRALRNSARRAIGFQLSLACFLALCGALAAIPE